MRDQQHEPVYVISVAARLAGLPCWILRVLDQEGIVVPVRTDSNRRLYSDNDIRLLARVRYLTASPPEGRGVNIAGVKVILEMERERAETGESLPGALDGPPAEVKQGAKPIALPPYASLTPGSGPAGEPSRK